MPIREFGKHASPLQSPTFLNQPPSALQGFDIDPRKILRRRSSLVVADLPPIQHKRPSLLDAYSAEGIMEEGKAAVNGAVNGTSDEENRLTDEEKKAREKKKPPPTQFQEPDANSLLDSFGF
jgi:hypothetical protein